MNRRHYLVTYDISSDKRRNSVFDCLMDNGDHAQYSVFLCQLTDMELAGIKAALGSMINAAEDQVLILDLGKVEHAVGPAVLALGKPYMAPVRSMIV